MRTRTIQNQIVSHTFLVIVSAICAVPLLYALLTSLKTKFEFINNPFGFPIATTLMNYVRTLQSGEFVVWFVNSLIVSGASAMGLSLFPAILMAYAIARFNFSGKELLFRGIVSLMAVPSVVVLIPLYREMVQIHLVNTHFGLILIYAGMTLPFSLYLLTSFFVSMPSEIVDAALIDGCSSFQILIRIYAPLSRPAIITVMVVNFTWLWGELLVTMVFMQSDKLKTLMPGMLTYVTARSTDVPLVMASLMMATVPTLIIYLLGLKYFVKGMMAGFLK